MALRTLLAAIALAHGGIAMAQPVAAGSAAAAEALFQEGRALLMAGQVDEACPKLQESQRLDPATGTLLALALCHEQQGKLASAWAAFADIEARSRQEGRADRERTAREHGAALRARLSTLTVAVPADAGDTPGLEISVDGVPLGRPAWNAALPIDGGTHVVAAAVPGRTPWRASVSIAPESDQARVLVLVPTAPPDPAVSLVDETGAPSTRPSSARRIVALAAMGAGLIGLGTSVLLGLDARSDYRAARDRCGDEGCTPEPYRQVQAARHRGDVATIVGIVGGTLAAGGAALWLWPESASTDGPRRATAARVTIAPAGLVISGRF